MTVEGCIVCSTVNMDEIGLALATISIVIIIFIVLFIIYLLKSR